jgi:integral membrane protein
MNASMRRYRVMAYIVGVALIILVLVGVPLQYAAGESIVVTVVGPIHGILYIIYLLSALDLARRARFSIPQMIAMVCAGLVPFLAFVVERWITSQVEKGSAGSSPGTPRSQ